MIFRTKLSYERQSLRLREEHQNSIAAAWGDYPETENFKELDLIMSKKSKSNLSGRAAFIK